MLVTKVFKHFGKEGQELAQIVNQFHNLATGKWELVSEHFIQPHLEMSKTGPKVELEVYGILKKRGSY